MKGQVVRDQVVRCVAGRVASVRLGGSGGDLGRSEPLVGRGRPKLVCLTRMDRVSPGDGWCPGRTCCFESLDLTRNLVLAIFQSGLDNRLCRLFGGVGVLPLGFFRYLHTPPARALGCVHNCPSGVHTGLGVPSGPVWWAGICRERSILFSVSHTSLPGWSSAEFWPDLPSRNGRGSPKCAKRSQG